MTNESTPFSEWEETESRREAEERLAFTEEVAKRIDHAFKSVGLEGTGEDYRKQKFPDGVRERRFVSKTATKTTSTGTVDYVKIQPDNTVASGSFSLGVSRRDDKPESASAAFLSDENSAVEGQIALALIDLVIADIFPDRINTSSEQTPQTEA